MTTKTESQKTTIQADSWRNVATALRQLAVAAARTDGTEEAGRTCALAWKKYFDSLNPIIGRRSREVERLLRAWHEFASAAASGGDVHKALKRFRCVEKWV